MPSECENDEIETGPTYLPETRWFIAMGVSLVLAAAAWGLRYWMTEAVWDLYFIRGVTYGPDHSVEYGRAFTLDEAARMWQLRSLALLGSVIVALAVPATIISAIGLWIVRAENRKRFQFDALLRQRAIFQDEDRG